MDGLLLIAFAILAYFLPTIIASLRGHHNDVAIFVLNLLLGWTLLGWVIALVWSLTAKTKTATATGEPVATPDTHVRCPECRELVRMDATKCRWCNCKLTPAKWSNQ